MRESHTKKTSQYNEVNENASSIRLNRIFAVRKQNPCDFGQIEAIPLFSPMRHGRCSQARNPKRSSWKRAENDNRGSSKKNISKSITPNSGRWCRQKVKLYKNKTNKEANSKKTQQKSNSWRDERFVGRRLPFVFAQRSMCSLTTACVSVRCDFGPAKPRIGQIELLLVFCLVRPIHRSHFMSIDDGGEVLMCVVLVLLSWAAMRWAVEQFTVLNLMRSTSCRMIYVNRRWCCMLLESVASVCRVAGLMNIIGSITHVLAHTDELRSDGIRWNLAFAFRLFDLWRIVSSMKNEDVSADPLLIYLWSVLVRNDTHAPLQCIDQTVTTHWIIQIHSVTSNINIFIGSAFVRSVLWLLFFVDHLS